MAAAPPRGGCHGPIGNSGSRTNGLTIASLSLAAVRDLLEPPPGPCLTLSLPTHRNVPDNRVDQPSYRHLVESLEMALSLSRRRDQIEHLLRPFYQLASDRRFWEHTREGLVVFGAEGWARVFLLPQPVKPLALVLVALPQLAAVFRGLSKNRQLLEASVAKDVHLAPQRELGPLVLPIFAAERRRRIDRERRLFELARNRGLAAADLPGIARAAAAGRVATLLVEQNRFVPGWLNRSTGRVHPDGEVPDDLARSGDRSAIRTEDIIGAVAETALLHGGEILSLEHGQMPSVSGLAAIYRY